MQHRVTRLHKTERKRACLQVRELHVLPQCAKKWQPRTQQHRDGGDGDLVQQSSGNKRLHRASAIYVQAWVPLCGGVPWGRARSVVLKT